MSTSQRLYEKYKNSPILSKLGKKWKNVYLIFAFNAYQPRVNKKVFINYEKEKRIYDFKKFDPLLEKKLEKAEQTRKINILDYAITKSYIPILSLAEKFPDSITLIFSQITLDEIKNFYPNLYKKITKMSEKEIELGLSSYHHVIPQMLDEKEIYYEYFLPLEKNSFYKNDITVHFPEQITCEKLIKSLHNYALQKDIHFTILLDSTHHNLSYNEIRIPIVFKNFPRIRAIFRHNYLSNQIAFHTNIIDPESTAVDIMSYYINSLFFDPYFSSKAERGEKIYLLLAVDAETIGMHIKNLDLAFFEFFKLANEYFTLSSVRKYINEFSFRKIEDKIAFNKSWSGGLERWYRNETKFLKDRINKIRERVHKVLETDVSEKKLMRLKFLISSYYFNSMLSCPYWWNDPNAPVTVEAIRNIEKVEEYVEKFEKVKEED